MIFQEKGNYILNQILLVAQLSQLHIGFGYNKDVNDEFKKNAFSKAL